MKYLRLCFCILLWTLTSACQSKPTEEPLSKEDLAYYLGLKEAEDSIEEPQIVEEKGNSEDLYMTFHEVLLEIKEHEELSKERYYENIKEHNGTISLTTDRKILYPKGRYDVHYMVCRDETCGDYKTYRIQLLVE